MLACLVTIGFAIDEVELTLHYLYITIRTGSFELSTLCLGSRFDWSVMKLFCQESPIFGRIFCTATWLALIQRRIISTVHILGGQHNVLLCLWQYSVFWYEFKYTHITWVVKLIARWRITSLSSTVIFNGSLSLSPTTLVITTLNYHMGGQHPDQLFYWSARWPITWVAKTLSWLPLLVPTRIRNKLKFGWHVDILLFSIFEINLVDTRTYFKVITKCITNKQVVSLSIR